MKTLTTLAITTLFAITLSACAGETVYVHDSENGGADTGGQGGETSIKSELETAKGGAEAVTTATATEAPKPEPLCVPGASDECACPGGTKGAQSCAKDGQSYGECVCEPKVVTKTETVTETNTETVYVDKPVEVPVPPVGYSGECLKIGDVASGVTVGACPTWARVLFINCKEPPKNCLSVDQINEALDGTLTLTLTGTPGAYCCNP